ncbi:MAG: phage holin family protein [Bifidobacteriaceae bacterium]|jgi:hypothetical protein|nr:phage holin family protein [Bifidobacteriaceae bacterium]
MANRPIRELAGDVQDDVTAIVGDITTLAKAELRRDGSKLGVGLAAFAAAAGGVILALILLSIVIAEVLVALGLMPWAAYLIDVGIVLLIAGALVLVGKTAFGKVTGPTRTLSAVRGLLTAIGGRNPAEAGAGPLPTESPEAIA